MDKNVRVYDARCSKCEGRHVDESQDKRTCVKCGHTWQRRSYTYTGLGAYKRPRSLRELSGKS